MQAAISEIVNKRLGEGAGERSYNGRKWGAESQGSCDCTDHTSRQATRSQEGVCGSTTAPWESLTQSGETHCSREFLRVRVRCQSVFVLWHPFPSSVMLLGLYVTSACTIKLLWIFMIGLKTLFSVPQVSQSGCNQNSEKSTAALHR